MTDPKPVPDRSLFGRQRTLTTPPEAEQHRAWPEVARALRNARGVTQEGWAAQLGLSDVTVRRWEHGVAVPTAQAEETLIAWCRTQRLFRAYDSGPLQGMTLTPELLSELLAAARFGARPRRAGAGSAPPPPRVPPAEAFEPPAQRPAVALPVSPTRLIGRAAEMDRIQSLIQERAVRLITLTGPGGAGKTRLAIEAARLLQTEFPGGVWIVRLEALRDPNLVLSSIAATLGIDEIGARPLRDQVRAALSASAALLVLDNFEQVLAAASLVAELLTGCPALTLLVTSRAPLRIDGEHALAIAPLDEASALQLFAERVAAVDPGFQLTEAVSPVVAAICVRLDYLPLAIELAAVWVRVLSLEGLRERLPQTVARRSARRGVRPARHQALSATVAWSYELLDTQEQTLFRRLAVFAGGWTLAAAEAVCAGETVATDDVLPLLAQLVEQSLVVAERSGNDVRYRFLETIWEFAATELAGMDEGEALRARHRDWFLTLAERESRNGVVGLEVVARDHDNFRVALSWQSGEAAEAELRLRLVAALWRFWQLRGFLPEGRRRLEEALAAAPDAPLHLRARVLNGLGSIAFYQGDMSAAEAAYGAALAARRALGDQRGALVALGNRATAAFNLGDVERAGAWWEEGLVLARGLDDQRGVAQSLGGLSLKAQHDGDHHRARALLEEAHTIWLALGDEIWLGRSFGNLATAAYYQGDDEAVLRLGEESLAIGRRVGNKRNIAMALQLLASSHRRRGDLAAARRLHHEALPIFGAFGGWPGLAGEFEAVAALAADAGLPLPAARLFGAATAVRQQHAVPRFRYLLPEYEAALAAARAGAPTDEEWSAAWTAGEVGTVDEAISVALSITGGDGGVS